MKKLQNIAISILVFLLAARTLCAFEKSWIQEEKLGLQTQDTQFLANKHVVFVAGFMNEWTDYLENYFDDNIRAVKSMGGTYTYTPPSSKLSIIENSMLLYNQVMGLSRSIKKPIILVGHSKGGAEILYMLLTHPELILDGYVDRALLIQAARGGSLLADNASGILYKVFSSLWSPNTHTLSKFPSLTTFQSGFELYNKNLKTFGKTTGLNVYDKYRDNLHKCISSRIFYVRSSATHLSFGLQLILGVLQDNPNNYSQKHDGLLAVEDQYDPNIGIDLGILEDVDHIDLTVSIVSNMSSTRREAFTRAAFKALYAQEPYIYKPE